MKAEEIIAKMVYIGVLLMIVGVWVSAMEKGAIQNFVKYFLSAPLGIKLVLLGVIVAGAPFVLAAIYIVFVEPLVKTIKKREKNERGSA